MYLLPLSFFLFFFFNDTATTEIYTLSLHDALPISQDWEMRNSECRMRSFKRSVVRRTTRHSNSDRKSTRLNSSHLVISYAVFCLKKKKTKSIPCSIIRSTTTRAGQHTSCMTHQRVS